MIISNRGSWFSTSRPDLYNFQIIKNIDMINLMIIINMVIKINLIIRCQFSIKPAVPALKLDQFGRRLSLAASTLVLR